MAAVLLAPTSALADEEADLPLKPEREVAFTVDEATWLSLDVSPAGDTLVLEILGDLYLLPIERGKARAITRGLAYDTQPRFSPDGERIAFVSDRDGPNAVWTVDRDGGDAKKIGSGGDRADYASPSWSPDGERIVALRAASYDRLYRENDFGAPVGSDLVWLPAAGGPDSLIMPSRGYGAPHFGPEADRVYVYASGGLFGSPGLISCASTAPTGGC